MWRVLRLTMLSKAANVRELKKFRGTSLIDAMAKLYTSSLTRHAPSTETTAPMQATQPMQGHRSRDRQENPAELATSAQRGKCHRRAQEGTHIHNHREARPHQRRLLATNAGDAPDARRDLDSGADAPANIHHSENERSPTPRPQALGADATDACAHGDAPTLRQKASGTGSDTHRLAVDRTQRC